MPIIKGFELLTNLPEEKLTGQITRSVLAGDKEMIVRWSMKARAPVAPASACRATAATGKIAVVTVFSVVSLVLSLRLSGRKLVRLPADYFTSRLRPPPTSLWAKVGLKLLGGAMVIVGIALAIPG